MCVDIGYDYINTIMNDGHWWENDEIGTAVLVLKWWYEKDMGETVYVKHTVGDNDNVFAGSITELPVNLPPEVTTEYFIHCTSRRSTVLVGDNGIEYDGPRQGHYAFSRKFLHASLREN